MEESLVDPRNPAAMNPAQRRQEIAAILAHGVLRLRQCAPMSPNSPSTCTAEKNSKILQMGLDESAQTSPDVPA